MWNSFITPEGINEKQTVMERIGMVVRLIISPETPKAMSFIISFGRWEFTLNHLLLPQVYLAVVVINWGAVQAVAPQFMTSKVLVNSCHE